MSNEPLGRVATNPQPCNRVEATKFPENARVAIGEFASHQQKFMHPKFGTAKVEVGGSRCLPDRESGQVDILVHVRLLTRWASLPSRAPAIDFRDADNEEDLYGRDGPREFRRLQECRRQRQSFKGAYLRALQQSPKLTAEGKEYPFIPCTCCERASPIPRLRPPKLGINARNAIALYACKEAWQ
eukprot:symbB.v1.2.004096.t1/scaffold200.1/size464218/26